MGTPGLAGGRPQRTAESGGERWSRTGLQPLLPSHSLLPTTGQNLAVKAYFHTFSTYIFFHIELLVTHTVEGDILLEKHSKNQ